MPWTMRCARIIERRSFLFGKATPFATSSSSTLPEAWQAAYGAGMFTEFQEQRSPGHTACGDIPYRFGLLDLKDRIRKALDKLDYARDVQALDKQHQLEAMDIAADGMLAFARRHAEALEQMAREESDAFRREELVQMAAVCRRVPAHAPQTFWEALQAYWFVHVGVISELNPWDAFNPGRLDQHLYPFYKKDLEAGRLTRESAKELLCAFWIKFNNHPRTAQDRRDGRGEQHLCGFRPDQCGRGEGRRQRRGQRTQLPDP